MYHAHGPYGHMHLSVDEAFDSIRFDSQANAIQVLTAIYRRCEPEPTSARSTVEASRAQCGCPAHTPKIESATAHRSTCEGL